MADKGKLSIKNELLIRRSPENLFFEYIAYHITDTGKGIPKEHQDKLFNPFFTTKSEGTGLGLAICKAIIEAHGGRIWAESVAGESATFYFTIQKNLQ